MARFHVPGPAGRQTERVGIEVRRPSGSYDWTVKSIEITVRTGHRRGLFDLTAECARVVEGEGAGLLNVFVPHASAGVGVMELGAGSDEDLVATLDTLLPRDDRWRHRHGSRGHGADHVVPLLASPSVSVPVIGGRLALGTWQSIALLDSNADNATRTVRLSFLEG
jgi:secondary thiamine-phosphate synthase enzyme